MQPSQTDLNGGEVLFPNGNRARWVRAQPDTQPREVVRALGLSRPRTLLLLLGGAEGLELESEVGARLRQLFSRGIARAAAETGALILDGGTQSGSMSLMGEGVIDWGAHSPLVGVAPAGLVTYPGGPASEGDGPRSPLDSHHSHFVLVDGDTWGEETPTLYRLAEHLAQSIPVVAVLVNGGERSKQEVLQAVRRGWPTVVLQGSGRLADELARLVHPHSTAPADPALAEIITDGQLDVFPLHGSPRELNRLLRRELREDSILKLAWQRYATYDASASRQQRIFQRLQFWTLLLSFLSTLVALLAEQLRPLPSLQERGSVDAFLYFMGVLLAATLTVLVAASTRFKSGARWIRLRAHAEALKREIYRHRCRMGPRTGRSSRDRLLASRMKSISRQLMQSEANLSAVRAYRGRLPPGSEAERGDDGFSPLTPSGYIRYRLDDQLDYYRRRIDALDRRSSQLQWTLIVAGALGTVLVAAGWGLWVPLTTALVMVLTAWLGFQQTGNRLMKYQQAATDLDNIKAWWSALSLEDTGKPRYFEALVDSTELVLQGELTGWVQEMKEALVRLTPRSDKSDEQEVGEAKEVH
ncbi:DUF4231 domain-containing protein [Archangium violaceum]|uniref:DUF4231 domain-containing protein n=1 Tax=Archangium violaceum TaxID=83451 RepID=UPI002B2ACEBB|nr:DUF4231 domain-containing protein [Archangium gephyra]